MCSLHSCYLREKSFMGVEGSGLFNVIWLKSIHTFTFIVTVFTASASICVSSRNASLYIAVMIFCAQPYLKPCFMCPFYILSTCPSKGLCTALVTGVLNFLHLYTICLTVDLWSPNPLEMALWPFPAWWATETIFLRSSEISFVRAMIHFHKHDQTLTDPCSLN